MDNLRDDAKRIARAIGQGRVTWKLLVRQIRIIFDRPRWLHYIDSFSPTSYRQFSAPDCSVQRTGEINPGQGIGLPEIGLIADDDQIAGLESGPRSVEKRLRKLGCSS